MSDPSKPMSKSEAIRLIKAGAVEINGVKHTDPNELIDFPKGREVVVRVGKRVWRRFVSRHKTYMERLEEAMMEASE